jgi:uncharacterized protein YdhG (YjbR/CyaY superfamily)
MQNAVENVDKYIEQFPPEIRELLDQMRKVIRKAAPNAEETISYAIPSYKLNGILKTHRFLPGRRRDRGVR